MHDKNAVFSEQRRRHAIVHLAALVQDRAAAVREPYANQIAILQNDGIAVDAAAFAESQSCFRHDATRRGFRIPFEQLPAPGVNIVSVQRGAGDILRGCGK